MVRKAFQGRIFLRACFRFCPGTAYIVPPISPTSPHTMSSSGPYYPADPLGDELAQIELLDQLAEKYGWDTDSKEYLRRLALIQKAGAKALKMAAGPARGGGGAASHPSFGKPKNG